MCIFFLFIPCEWPASVYSQPNANDLLVKMTMRFELFVDFWHHIIVYKNSQTSQTKHFVTSLRDLGNIWIQLKSVLMFWKRQRSDEDTVRISNNAHVISLEDIG